MHVFIVEVRPECYVDDDCGYSDICFKGSCVDACRLSQCGFNAKCESSLHSAQCICLPGYTGNPQSACTLCKQQMFSYFIVYLSSLHDFKRMFSLQLTCQKSLFYPWDVFKMKTVHFTLHVKIQNVSTHVLKIIHVLEPQFAKF